MGLAFPKPTPHILTKGQKAKAVEQHRRETKRAVFARDGGRCRVCGDAATEMHELRFRSLGGKRSLENSIAVCAFGSRHNCHALLQRNCIEYEGDNAQQRVVFHWAEWVKPEQRTFRIRSKRRSQNKDAA